MCHTGTLHQVARLDSIYYLTVFRRCSNLVLSALKCESQLAIVHEVFAAALLSWFIPLLVIILHLNPAI